MKRAIEETHGVKLLMGALRVAYRETITHELSVDYCMDKECTLLYSRVVGIPIGG